MEDIYTSTGLKYVRHPAMIEALRHGYGRPQSLQVSLTNRCNLNCTFCSVSNRDKKLEWQEKVLQDAILTFVRSGIKTVEFSGGGEPTLHPHFTEIVTFCKDDLGLKLGLISNGIKLKDIPRGTLEKFEWIRISLTCLDYVENIELPFIDKPTLGFSYIVGYNSQAELFTLNKIVKYVDKYKPKYVRIVPECFTGKKKMMQIHKCWGRIINNWFGSPFFFQHKMQSRAQYCYMDAVKPWLHTDGFVYPCNSVSLHTEAKRDFSSDYRICHWTEIEGYYKNRGNKSLLWVEQRCDRCTFTKNNRILHELITPIIHGEFM